MIAAINISNPLKDFQKSSTDMKNPVTPLILQTDRKYSAHAQATHEYNGESSYSPLSPPPPPQRRRYTDNDRITSAMDPLSNHLLVFPSLSSSNLQRKGNHDGNSSGVPRFKLQPRRCCALIMDKECFK